MSSHDAVLHARRNCLDMESIVEGLVTTGCLGVDSNRSTPEANGCNRRKRGVQDEPLGRVDTSGSLATGPPGRRRPATKFNAPDVLQTDRARAKTRKLDTTRPRNRFLPGADSQLCHR